MSEEFKPSQDKRITLSPEKLSQKKEESLKNLKVWRFDFIEELPSERLRPEMPNYNRYKCRTNFFSFISLTIVYLKQIGLIKSPEAQKECGNFLSFCKTLQGRREFYKQEDIDKANKVLDCLIKDLSN